MSTVSQETIKATTVYTEFHPRWYRAPVSVYWWLGQRQYLKFILRELSSVFVASFVVITLLQLRALLGGPAAYTRFEHWLQTPPAIVLNVISFFFVLFHTITWFNGDDGSFLPAYAGDVNAAASSGAVRSPESGSVSFALLQQSLRAGEHPSLPRSLIVDAEEHLRTQRLREAIISLGTACEVASNEYLIRTGRESEPQVGRILSRRESFAEKRYHLLTDYLSGRSFKNEDLPSFEFVEKTYRTRNSLAHKGRLCFDDAGTVIEVDQRLATHFLAASEAAINWVGGI